jgi:histidinol phosphatase-like PHP family hydrolase
MYTETFLLQFYNDFHFRSKIKVLGQGAITEQSAVRSSTNTMSLGYWSSIGHRGLKLRYAAVAPARKLQIIIEHLKFIHHYNSAI